MKNNFLLKISTLAASFLAVEAMAVPIVLDFEGAGDQTSLLEFYNGGADSGGNSGVDYGLSFGDSALSIIDADAGGTGNIANEPSGDTVLFFLTGSAVLNSAAGFDTGFSFFYSSSEDIMDAINVYDGLNATGNLLASIDLTSQANTGCTGDPNGFFCNWTAAGATFAGTAMSVDFGGTVNQVGYDDITFGSSTAGGGPIDPPTGQVPAPATLALFGLGLAGLGWSKRKKV